MAIKDKVDFARVDKLIEFSMGMMEGKDGSRLIEKYQEAIENITPFDMVALEEKQLERGVDLKKIKQDIEKIINVLKPALDSYEWENPGEGHPIYYYMKENRRLEELLGETKKTIKSIKFENLNQEETAEKLRKFEQQIEELSQFNCHYIRKENILFPYLEASWDYTRPLQVMWSIHDDIRTGWKKVLAGVRRDRDLTSEIDKKLGRLFLMAYRMAHKEEQIIFPLAMEALTEADWAEMLLQEPELGYFQIDGPDQEQLNNAQQLLARTGSVRDISQSGDDREIKAAVLEFVTGRLSKEQLKLIFNYLPVDITYVDENDQVRFFS
ncbi:MAG: hemerythrin domain-containing protein, partial [Halarsenatibacteraceae bacterium]